MGKPATLLEALCGHARLLGAQSIEVEHKDGREWVIADKEAPVPCPLEPLVADPTAFYELPGILPSAMLIIEADLFAALSPEVLHGYQQRASAEDPYPLRRHPPPPSDRSRLRA